jgi:hypothetical protein
MGFTDEDAASIYSRVQILLPLHTFKTRKKDQIIADLKRNITRANDSSMLLQLPPSATNSQ